MSDYPRIAQAFHQRIDVIAGTVDLLAPALEEAADRLLQAVMNDRRMLICGCGHDGALARYATTLFLDSDGRVPPLPALMVDGEGADSERLWSNLRSLSRDGDLLLCIDSSSDANAAMRSAQLAQQRNLDAILLSNAQPATAGNALLLPVPAEAAQTRRELAVMALHTLRELLIQRLMGD